MSREENNLEIPRENIQKFVVKTNTGISARQPERELNVSIKKQTSSAQKQYLLE